MKKEVIISLLVFAVVISCSFYTITNSSEKVLFSPDEISITIPTDCSDESVKAVWDEVFEISSSGISIETGAIVRGFCESYIANKTVNNQIYILGGTTITNVSRIFFINGNSIAEIFIPLNAAKSIIGSDSDTFFEIISGVSNSDKYFNVRGAEISSEVGAKIIFDSIFKISNSTEFSGTTSEYSFEESKEVFSESVKTKFSIVGEVFKKNETNVLFYAKEVTSPSACTPSWNATNTSCISNETLIEWFRDENSCNSYTNYPGNNSYSCDYDGNGIIGSEDSVSTDNVDLGVKISGLKLNVTKTYEGERTIEIQNNGKTIISFEQNLSEEPFDLTNIRIRRPASLANLGYIIVEGIEKAKTVKLDRRNNGTKVCVKDRSGISAISAVSNDCLDNYEYIVDCPGTNGRFTCSLTNTTFTVSGLTHSAVKEFVPIISNCTANWFCGAWGECSNGTHVKVCSDLNGCGTMVGMPNETESCVPTCAPDWDCGDWTPEVCPENGKQIRTCVDKNTCGNSTKTETKICKYKESSVLMIVIIIGAILLVLGLITLLTYILRKGNSDDENGNSFGSVSKPSSPLSPKPKPTSYRMGMQQRRMSPSPIPRGNVSRQAPRF